MRSSELDHTSALVTGQANVYFYWKFSEMLRPESEVRMRKYSRKATPEKDYRINLWPLKLKSQRAKQLLYTGQAQHSAAAAVTMWFSIDFIHRINIGFENRLHTG